MPPLLNPLVRGTRRDSIECCLYGPLHSLAAKPAGAYRPPGARGLATPSIFKREDEGGVSHSPSNGTSPAPSRTGTPASAGRYANGQTYVPGGGPGRQRVVPGAPPPGSPQDDPRKQNNKKKGKGKKDTGYGEGANGVETVKVEAPPPPAAVVEIPVVVPVPVIAEVETGLDPAAKKIRNLSKKVSPAIVLHSYRCLPDAPLITYSSRP